MLQQAHKHIASLLLSSAQENNSSLQCVITFSDCLSQEQIVIPHIQKSHELLRKIAVVIEQEQELFNVTFNITTSRQFFTYAKQCGNLDSVLKVLNAMCALPFRQAHAQMPAKDMYFKMKGTLHGPDKKTLLMRTSGPSKKHWESKRNEYQHDCINPINALPLLNVLGICDKQGGIIPSMRDKYKQINHFIQLYKQQAEYLNDAPIRFIDCGCGKAYLSLALLYLTSIIENKSATLIGIEQNKSLVDFCNDAAKQLNLEHNASFVAGSISSWNVDADDTSQNVVIALHACDTATDDALALALKAHAAIILAAPCCHHYVQQQMKPDSMPEAMQSLVRDGISKERLGDLLTDSLRRDILLSKGYSSELIEFTPLEHTSKNIMIRARFIPTMPAKHKDEAKKRMQKTMEEWHVHPKLSELLND